MAPIIETLATLAPPAVREGDRVGLRAYIRRVTLCREDFRPMLAVEFGSRLREFTHGFVYDRTASLIIACDYSMHSRAAGGLACLRTLPFPFDIHVEADRVSRCHGQAADRFLAEGWGFVVNSPRLSGTDLNRPWPVRLGADVTLTAQEKLWFRGFDLIRVD